MFCLLHVDVHQLQIDDSDGKIVDHESSCDVLNVALWITPADSIGKNIQFPQGVPREIWKTKILEGAEKTHLQTWSTKEKKLQR